MTQKIEAVVLRSPLGRVRGLGAGHSGTRQWWGQRASAVALVPLAVWFVGSVLGLLGAPQEVAARWAGRPWHAVLLLALLAALFYHLELGVSAVIEDYVPQPLLQRASRLVVRGVVILLFLRGALAILHLALS
jgi:succinate dehydrogenase / fumarate reductase membrane anchor subunit